VRHCDSTSAWLSVLKKKSLSGLDLKLHHWHQMRTLMKFSTHDCPACQEMAGFDASVVAELGFSFVDINMKNIESYRVLSGLSKIPFVLSFWSARDRATHLHLGGSPRRRIHYLW
jgi:hypothetical protein